MIGSLFSSKDCQSFEPWTSNLGCRRSSRKTPRGDSQLLMTSQETVEPDRPIQESTLSDFVVPGFSEKPSFLRNRSESLAASTLGYTRVLRSSRLLRSSSPGNRDATQTADVTVPGSERQQVVTD
jgi:hypothetical protein